MDQIGSFFALDGSNPGEDDDSRRTGRIRAETWRLGPIQQGADGERVRANDAGTRPMGREGAHERWRIAIIK